MVAYKEAALSLPMNILEEVLHWIKEVRTACSKS
jgi:hypothetical protein